MLGLAPPMLLGDRLKGIKTVAKVSYVRVLVNTLFLVYDATNHVDDSNLIRAAAALYVDASLEVHGIYSALE